MEKRARGTAQRRPALRTLVMIPALIAMLVGANAGLGLLGVWTVGNPGRVVEVHGIVMVLGFLGTLIAAERAVAWGRPIGYAAPVLLGAGALCLALPVATLAGRVLIPLGALGLCLIYVPLWRRQRDDAVLLSALGAVLALGAALLWSRGADTSAVLPWLMGFPVLTIVGERLELARIAMPARAGSDLVALGVAMAVAVGAATLWPAVGAPLLGASLLLLAGWLMVHDVARRTIRGSGLPRFAAACLVAGQFWLVVAGVIWVIAGPVREGPAYDAIVHAIFLGYAISMVMAHAPTILPAVTRIRLPYRPVMYLPWAVLQLSLVVRLWGGDAQGSEVAREVGGIGNVIGLLGFFAVAAWSAATAGRDPATPTRETVTG